MNTKPKDKFKPEDYMNAMSPIEDRETTNLPVKYDAEAQIAEMQRSGLAAVSPHYSTRIATALAEIMGEIGGVAKHGENKFHNYKYVRIEDILSKVTPLLASHGIVIIQSEVSRAMFDDDKVVSVTYSFTIAHRSGDVWPEKAMHTGMSNARNSKGGFDDKAFNKCHTAARKYFLKALFQITDDEDNTTDADSQEDRGPTRIPLRTVATTPREGQQKPTQPVVNKARRDVKTEQQPSSAAPSVSLDPEAFLAFMEAKLKACTNGEDLWPMWLEFVDPVQADMFPPDFAALKDKFSRRKEELAA